MHCCCGTAIGYVAAPLDAAAWNAGRCDRVLDHVAEPLLGDRRRPSETKIAARHALERVGASGCIHASTNELSLGERTRVSLARAIVREPRLLLVDEPALMPSPSERDEIRLLLRSLADERHDADRHLAGHQRAAGRAADAVGRRRPAAVHRPSRHRGAISAREGRQLSRAERAGALELRDLVKHYPSDGEVVRAVDGVSLAVAPGEFAALYGPSGSGKTTLLTLAAGIAHPDAGQVCSPGATSLRWESARARATGARRSASCSRRST